MHTHTLTPSSPACAHRPPIFVHTVFVAPIFVHTAFVASQVGVTCREHGELLSSLRSNYASSFQSVARLHSDTLWQLDAVVGGLIRCWRRLRKAESVWKDHERQLQLDSDRRVQDVERAFEKEYQEVAKVRENATSEVERMRRTLTTLNDIFKDMQNDKVTMSLQDFMSKTSTLEKQIISLQSDVETASAYKRELLREQIQSALARKEIEKLKEQLQETTDILQTKDKQIEELENEEYMRRVELEKLKRDMEVRERTLARPCFHGKHGRAESRPAYPPPKTAPPSPYTHFVRSQNLLQKLLLPSSSTRFALSSNARFFFLRRRTRRTTRPRTPPTAPARARSASSLPCTWPASPRTARFCGRRP